MIDFSKYTLPEMQAIVTVLDDLTGEMAVERGYENDFYIALFAYQRARAQATALIDQQALYSSGKVQLFSLYGTCVTDDAPPAEKPDRKFNVQALLDGLCWCSDCCNALAIGEDIHFSVCSETEVFNKVTMLRDCKQVLNNMVSDIRDHYDGLH